MSRHRNVRKMSYDDFDDDFDVGSVEDDCISPTDASQWIYDRNKSQQSMYRFQADHTDIAEEDEEAVGGQAVLQRRDSENYQLPDLDDESKAKLLSCMDEIRGIIGDTVADRQLVETIMQFDYDCAKALDQLLTNQVERKASDDLTKIEKGERLNISNFIQTKLSLFSVEGKIQQRKNLLFRLLNLSRRRPPVIWRSW